MGGDLPFDKCFVHAVRGGETENVEEVTVPVLSLLDDKWAAYSLEFIRRMAEPEPAERSPAVPLPLHPGGPLRQLPPRAVPRLVTGQAPVQGHHHRAGRHRGGLVAELEATGQMEDTLIFVSSDNGPEMETWPDAAYSPFRSAKGSTWEGGQRGPAIAPGPGSSPPTWPATGCSPRWTCSTPSSTWPAPRPVPEDRYIDGVDQTSSLLDPDGVSNRKYLYYWLTNVFSALRVGEWKFMVASTSDDDRDCFNLGWVHRA